MACSFFTLAVHSRPSVSIASPTKQGTPPACLTLVHPNSHTPAVSPSAYPSPVDKGWPDPGIASNFTLLVNSVTPSIAENTQWDLLAILAMKGCSEGCATSVHSLQPGEILFFRGNFSARTIHQLSQWLLEYLNSNGSRVDMRFSFVVCGKLVCLPLWLAILGVSQRRFYRLRGEFLVGKVTLEKASSLQKLSKTSNAAIGWMENYFTRYDCHIMFLFNSYSLCCGLMHICLLLLPNDTF